MHLVVAALSLLLCTIGAESKGPCLGHYPMSLRPFAGVYVPQCTPFGYFKVVQVHGSTGHAWCVNPETGAKVESTDVAPGAGTPECGKCFFELAQYFGAGHVSIGRTKPQCDENGRFAPIQQSGSTGFSWCVNPETGEKLEGTAVAPGAGTPNCDAARNKRSIPGPCHAHRLSLRPVGQFIPQCTVMGFFKVIQVHGSTGYAWCVNPETGEKVEGSEVAPGAGQPECGKCLFALAKFYGPGFVLNPLGRNKPVCDANGFFKSQQSSASTGYTWCVNVETGEKIQGSDVAPGAEPANCEAREKRNAPERFGPCHVRRLTLRPGQFQPQCTPMGYFKVVQVYGSTGYSWCVNPESGDKVEGSDVAPGAGDPKCGQCLLALAKFYGPGPIYNVGPLGRVKPECDANGRFKPQQRSASTGYTWCVNVETGEKIAGTDVAPGAGTANCEARNKRAVGAGPCKAPEPSFNVGQFIPQCTPFGYFRVIQMHGSTGYAWCVNPETGTEVEGSAVGPGDGEPQCGQCFHKLLEYYSAGRVNIGRPYPQCDDQGRFKTLQQSASTGYSWCVNAETGEKIPGSEVGPTAGKANC